MQDDFTLSSYDYILPQENIAQFPSAEREASRLLVLNKISGKMDHKRFSDITSLIGADDIVVINDTRVFPARLHGKKQSGGKVEVFLLELPVERGEKEQNGPTRCAEGRALLKSSKRPAEGSRIEIAEKLFCIVSRHIDNGVTLVELHFPKGNTIIDLLSQYGSIPLPPYIERPDGTLPDDRDRYQTVYAGTHGAVAAPTAGLHFSAPVIDTLKNKGVAIASLTLHVGYGTFAPVREEQIKKHRIHKEYISISQETADTINITKQRGGKVWAVGTTTVRALESSCDDKGLVQEASGWCDLYIVPGFTFSVVDNLITNFHLPRSSLLFLVAALCGRETLLNSYREAIALKYRFYSYGDAMAIMS
ncbi:MAG: tRNA preQ1(34) S-adenosylmethionine ribosyltransferase-isomerase QueA [Desulfopila sp.]|jgi:S-adenosylmethionine:tRNA ribosyltransferase-isomerase|nr:tRNA preQ1(34) S-adenosylmethionine ribosyltransferase-isomerase QueA [Desulfopila sp.]